MLAKLAFVALLVAFGCWAACPVAWCLVGSLALASLVA